MGISISLSTAYTDEMEFSEAFLKTSLTMGFSVHCANVSLNVLALERSWYSSFVPSLNVFFTGLTEQ